MKQTMEEVGPGEDKGGNKFLTFFVGPEEYGLEILKVQEIISPMPITRIPRTPPAMLGVINLRGKVVPVMDLRVKLGLSGREKTDDTCMIIVKVKTIEVGLMVDRVSEVMTIPDKEIEKPPHFGRHADTSYLRGIGKTGGRVRLLLNIEKVLSDSDMFSLESVTLRDHQGEEK